MTNKSEQAIERLNKVETRFACSPAWKSFVDGGLSLIPGLGQAISFSRVHPSRKSRGAWRPTQIGFTLDQRRSAYQMAQAPGSGIRFRLL